jgi:hypothetical protein
MVAAAGAGATKTQEQVPQKLYSTENLNAKEKQVAANY